MSNDEPIFSSLTAKPQCTSDSQCINCEVIYTANPGPNGAWELLELDEAWDAFPCNLLGGGWINIQYDQCFKESFTTSSCPNANSFTAYANVGDYVVTSISGADYPEEVKCCDGQCVNSAGGQNSGCSP